MNLKEDYCFVKTNYYLIFQTHLFVLLTSALSWKNHLAVSTLEELSGLFHVLYNHVFAFVQVIGEQFTASDALWFDPTVAVLLIHVVR